MLESPISILYALLLDRIDFIFLVVIQDVMYLLNFYTWMFGDHINNVLTMAIDTSSQLLMTILG